MEVDGCASVGVTDFLVVDFGEPVVGRDGSAVGKDQSADGIIDGAVLLDSPVLGAQVAVDELLVVDEGLVGLSDVLVLLSVEDVGLGDIFIAGLCESALDSVLDVLDRDLVVLDLVRETRACTKREHLDDVLVVVLVRGYESPYDRVLYLLDIEADSFACSLQYLIHGDPLRPAFRGTYINQI